MGVAARLHRSPSGATQGKLIGGVKFLYAKNPTAEEVEAIGFTLEDYASPDGDGAYYDPKAKGWRFGLWADNWPAIQFYRQWHSQWNVVSGMSGVYYVGLNFGVLLTLLDRLDLSKDEHDDMLGCLREIESEARKHLNAA